MRYLILFLLVIGACSRGTPASKEQSPQEQAPAETKPPPTQPEQPTTDEGELGLSTETTPSLELVDKGGPPHSTLRANFEPGSKHVLEARSQWEITAGYGPFVSATSTMPSFKYKVEAEVKDVVENSTTFRFEVAKVDAKSDDKVKAAYVEQGKKAAATVQGVTGVFSIDGNGLVERFEIGTPAEATSLVHDMLEQVERAIRLSTLPVPKEPVGAGAKWTVREVIKQRGALTEQTSSFELMGREGPRVQVKLARQAAAPKQTFSLPGNPANARFNLDEIEYQAEGEGTWELGSLGPRTGSDKSDILFKMTSMGAKPEVVLMSRSVAIEVEATQ